MNDKRMIGIGFLLMGVWTVSTGAFYLEYAIRIIFGIEPVPHFPYLSLIMIVPGITWVIIGVKLVRRKDG